MNPVRLSSPHLMRHRRVPELMRDVVFAAVPGVVASIFMLGWGVLLQISLCIAACLFFEALALTLRQRPLIVYIGDYSAVVTGLLLGLALPPLTPWWMTLTACSFAILVTKHLYGGLGYNPFNPAMAGYVLLLIAFPAAMSEWPNTDTGLELGFVDSLIHIFIGSTPALPVDSLTSATPLDQLKIDLSQSFTMTEIRQHNVFGDIGGLGWEKINLGFLIGGLYLLIRRTITWRIPVSLLTGLFVIATVFQVFDLDTNPSALFHLFSGATMLGAFFIATDPVTASTTPTGRLIFGAGIGVLTYIIRTWGGYPDGFAFAVLIMNMTVPLIDELTRPRILGEPKD